MLIGLGARISDSNITDPYQIRPTDQTRAMVGPGSAQYQPGVSREASRSELTAVDRDKAFLLRCLGVDTAPHSRLIGRLEDGTSCSNTKQEQRQTCSDAESVECSGVDSANSHDGNLGIGEQWSALMNYTRP